ncbi:hypothetical protein [Kocuria flava]|uniref:Uncharacterized protein n=1 Tax=Kocuria flava TaxID=446860 RepID=A0ABQ0XF71_9MICC|nr:hypothetical protein [Kocuria flava]GEO93505.1 hypothetical protein KFL01_28110 [Kocuria flava]
MAELMRRYFDALEPFHRLLEGDLSPSWPRVEEFLDGNTQVIRAELPGIDPEQDMHPDPGRRPVLWRPAGLVHDHRAARGRSLHRGLQR